MEENQRRTLCAQLGIVDDSLGFLLILIAAVLLSFCGTALQRKGLCLTIRGETAAAETLPDVYPIRRTAGAMVVGALGFFLCLALNTWEQARAGTDPVACRSARTNLWASLFVLAAAVLRFQDLDFVKRCGGQARTPAQTEDSTLPA